MRNIFGRLALAVFLAAPATLATAQEVQQISANRDLNGDGQVEVFTLSWVKGSVDLRISNTGGADVVVPDIFWAGGSGQEPEIEVAPNGSVQLIAQNDSIGRNRWRLTLTIAFRRGDYVVAGVTWDERDTLELDDWMSCDINMLTGKGFLDDQRGRREVRGKAGAPSVRMWNSNVEMPPEPCR